MQPGGWQQRQQSSGFGGQAVEAGYTTIANAQARGYNVQQPAVGGGYGGADGGLHQSQSGYQQRTRQQNPNFERSTVDCNSSIIRTLQSRVFDLPGTYLGSQGSYLSLQPNTEYMRDLVLPQSMLNNPSNAFCTHHRHTAVNREKYPIYCAMWTPEGRRMITGAQSGEFTLWNGLHFNFETIVTGHEASNRIMTWSKDGQTMITGDDLGQIKYWNPEMAMLHLIDIQTCPQAHTGSVRGLSISPMDLKFASCADDHFVKVWDYNTQACEVSFNMGNGTRLSKPPSASAPVVKTRSYSEASSAACHFLTVLVVPTQTAREWTGTLSKACWSPATRTTS